MGVERTSMTPTKDGLTKVHPSRLEFLFLFEERESFFTHSTNTSLATRIQYTNTNRPRAPKNSKSVFANGPPPYYTDMSKTQTYPSDLTDAQWALIRPLFPKPHQRGRRRSLDYRRVLDAIFYLQRTGCPWRQLPHDFPPWGTVASYFCRAHVFDRHRFGIAAGTCVRHRRRLSVPDSVPRFF